MTRTLRVAALQFAMAKGDLYENIAQASALIEQAADVGAEIILPPELFSDHYFCKTQEETHFATAHRWAEHPAVVDMQKIAKARGVVIPVSIFEKDGPEYFNSVVMIDADGRALGVYRKSHIPDGPGYQEKFYFRPGNTGF